MGERYFITGVQLGMLVSIRESKERNKLMEEIIENQFICNLNNNEIKDFEREIKELKNKFNGESK